MLLKNLLLQCKIYYNSGCYCGILLRQGKVDLLFVMWCASLCMGHTKLTFIATLDSLGREQLIWICWNQRILDILTFGIMWLDPVGSDCQRHSALGLSIVDGSLKTLRSSPWDAKDISVSLFVPFLMSLWSSISIILPSLSLVNIYYTGRNFLAIIQLKPRHMVILQ